MTARKDWRKSTLEQRLEFLRELRGKTGQPLSLNALGAGAKPPIASGVMSRLAKRPRPSAEVLGRLARGWQVSLEWLATGAGQPELGVLVVAERVVEYGARYPNLVEALDELAGRLSPETIDAAQSMALHAPADLDVGTWAQTLLDLERKLRRERKTGEPIGRVVEDDDVPPAGR